jgi:hypothetical protein
VDRLFATFTPKVALVLGLAGSVVLPIAAGTAMQFGVRDLGLGLWASAGISLAIALAAYLTPTPTK